MDFENELLPVLRRVAGTWFRFDPDKQAEMLTMGWYIWKTRPQYTSIGAIAWIARKHVQRGLALPGLGMRQGNSDCYNGKIPLVRKFVTAGREPCQVRTVIARELVGLLRKEADGTDNVIMDRLFVGDTIAEASRVVGIGHSSVNKRMKNLRAKVK